MKNLIGIVVLTLLLTSGFSQSILPAMITESTSVDTISRDATPPATASSTSTTPASTTTTTLVPITSTPVATTSTSTTPVPTTSTSTTPVPTTFTSTTPAITTSISSTTTTSTSTTPMSTTLPVPVTTPEPPVPIVGSWNVSDGNTTCIRADLRIRFKIPVEGGFEYIALYPNASDLGSTCDGPNGTQQLVLRDTGYMLKMIFEKDSTNTYMKNITFQYKLQDTDGFVYNDSHFFSVKIGNSYLCHSIDNIPLVNVTMEVSQIHIQAFGGEGNTDYGTAEECDSDDKVNDMVPIAVGCALLALVVIVLIAYFVGRRRSRQKGYQSV